MAAQLADHLEAVRSPRGEVYSLDEARQWCRRLVHRTYENFSVLSSLVPVERRDDFAAIYAFCRCADDLGDEVSDRDEAASLLHRWRQQLHACNDGQAEHPVFVALSPVIRRHKLPIKPFDDLISAFEQDQRVTRYDTWTELLEYCALSANPVGRLVLMILGEPRTDELFKPSDQICTALQLTNHWQDIRRDMVDRDRIYVPGELIKIDHFEQRLIGSARQGYAVDRTFLEESRQLVRQCVERTWELYEQGAELEKHLSASSTPVVWLLTAGGQRVLRLIESWNFETVLHRPKLSRVGKISLVVMARWRAWTSRRRESNR